MKLAITNKEAIQLIPYRIKDKWGYCTSEKTIVIACQFEEAKQFSEGLAAIQLNNKWGVVDHTGKEIIACKYDKVSSFYEGLAHFEMNKKSAYIDQEGIEVIPYI